MLTGNIVNTNRTTGLEGDDNDIFQLTGTCGGELDNISCHTGRGDIQTGDV